MLFHIILLYIPLIFLAQACWVMNPWAACNGVSSAPLNKNSTEWRSRVSCCDKTRNISSMTQQLAASSLAPGLKEKANLAIYSTKICNLRFFFLPSSHRIEMTIQHQCMILIQRFPATAFQLHNNILNTSVNICHSMWFEWNVISTGHLLDVNINFLIFMSCILNITQFAFEKIDGLNLICVNTSRTGTEIC